MCLNDVREKVNEHIRSFKDFPKKGINFRDIMPLFSQPSIVEQLCNGIAHHIRSKIGSIDAVAALESRGFLFGPIVAIRLGVPFIPIRKKGKLPGDCIQATYVKEYGEDVIEIQKDAVSSGWRIVILDDLLATGGTIRAAVDVIEKAGAIVKEVFVIVELEPLRGRDKIPNIAVTSLISYPDA
ncbi:putative adenine phosphoribosyltransferase [Dictyocaulus viviparus]|uniref:Adenine phosphoribosyltransferase n=1 Tax=Dictyocaulus viviparus TaxID=29172 RepID=A0A0D8YFE4_DICVI|nr:putative adenine phosphoribosyltransferase [Dictyocaulus viviparus]